MALIYIDNLPPRTTKGNILHLLIETGNIPKDAIGKINLSDSRAIVEIPDEGAETAVTRLDGARVESRWVTVWQAMGRNISPKPDHFHKLHKLLQLEAEAQEKEALRQKDVGKHLTNLTIWDETAGLGGRLLLTLGLRNRQNNLPWHTLDAGTPIILAEENSPNQQTWRGVVSQKKRRSLELAFTNWPDSQAESFSVTASTDAIARQRQEMALARVRGARNNRLATLRDIIRQQEQPFFNALPQVNFLNTTLNASQKKSVAHALSAEDLAIIHGPPGTGKTTTVVELIRQAVAQGQKVLACAPSNMAVDNIFEKLLDAGEKVVRLGHPVRVTPHLRDQTLDVLVEKHHHTQLAKKLMKEAYALRRSANRWTRAKPIPGERRQKRDEAHDLISEAHVLQMQAAEQILERANILCATLTSLDSQLLGKIKFDLCVIDEAGQSTEPTNWIPLLRSDKLVLAGDPQQLPPTVISQKAVKQGLGISLIEQLTQAIPQASHLLDTQYRMHEQIMQFSSQQFYEGKLQADPSVANHLLSDLWDGGAGSEAETAVTFIDTAGASYDEEQDEQSRYNPQEATLAIRKAQTLLDIGMPPQDIAIISPYSAQVRWLTQQTPHPNLEINSIDGFQGREKEAIILSLVRSNMDGEIGFLADTRRVNVALTRARRKLIVIGDSATITQHPFYADLINYFEQIGAYRSVWEEAYP